ncbi:helix-turn-helix transcriptional regulator [Streptomyces olivaceus]|uniref:helix-turn-helix transcriptional regulator n=1 Tax=Streptomyces olivaceus TaxID=47716 RepID=UPI001CCDEE72|nr:helix-turn-helix transcriptional regulator [Streptomyces olivaceus]MBZ6194164.1 helix-turn-helix transcriptional regulator [Streptomyces olivaceus]MBZ6200943.1 helix-turn-helix transcriptional regulator [Streptomyces olivaceus]MBZ6205156.1 helix-turn-helix transcriptional regulator [Streptomyces olivaceus]
MGLAERRRALGYSQEELAHALGVDRRTVGRWESRTTTPQPPLRPRLAELLHLALDALDALVGQPQAAHPESAGTPPPDHHGSGDLDDMIRRQFLRALTITSALVALPPDEGAALTDGALRGTSEDCLRMNGHLWQVYQLARVKRSVYPVVRDQITALNDALEDRPRAEAPALCGAAGDLFQLAGELAFDGSRYTDAAASYTLAASASQEAKAYDLWACALVRHAYVDLYERRYADAVGTLSAAQELARRGDGSLSTRHWIASVLAEAYAGLGDLCACERALDQAEEVTGLGGPAHHNGGWLRFDGSRLAEERGARYLQLGRLDLAEKALVSALGQDLPASGQSLRRRGAVLTGLASVGARRQDPEQVLVYGGEALLLARTTSSGYVAHKLQGLRTDLGPLVREPRMAELNAGIDALCTT